MITIIYNNEHDGSDTVIISKLSQGKIEQLMN